jgi:hypothetical protein
VAAVAACLKIIRLLLDRGALDIDTTLIAAAHAGHAAVVDLFLTYVRKTNDYSIQSFRYLHYDGILLRLESQKSRAPSYSKFNLRFSGYFPFIPGCAINEESIIDEEILRLSRRTRSLVANEVALMRLRLLDMRKLSESCWTTERIWKALILLVG